ncbi:MAG: hypothetical protein KDJ42_03475 [Alphaproteobacteria bacterium]|nr:hypothetical protein [Alphaproteobacteria bacterium]
MFRILLLITVLFYASPARADYFLWEDQKSGLTISFPDTWKVQSNRNPDDIFTVMAPSENDQPVCKVKVREERRYVIYPPKFGSDVQKVAVSAPFWEQYLGEYSGHNLSNVYDGAGLGRWFASYALASYATYSGNVLQHRRALMFASLYNDKLYILECSTLNHAYEDWRVIFQSIVKSIDFKKAYNENVTGYYANFLKGADHYFWSQTDPVGTAGY